MKSPNTEFFLVRIQENTDQKKLRIFDTLHLAIPHAGQAPLFLRSDKYNSSSNKTHITDLYSILNSKMEITSHNSFKLISEGEPDFNQVSILNQIYRLFKILELDLLSVFTYVARYSVFNPIKQLWSVKSNKLSGVGFRK